MTNTLTHENTLPDEITITWCIMDMQEIRPDLTDQQAREVLHHAKRCHDDDCNIGITWDTLTIWARELFGDEPDDPETDDEEGGTL